ncbi:MAG: hypothetical protein ACJASX_001850 [Limisphaerales bacterium]|jgi:hypothetical protein
MNIRLLIGFALLLGLRTTPAVDTQVTTFFRSYCVKCHGLKKQQGDFRVDELQVSQTPADAEYWQLVLDNLNLAEMPPEDEQQPTDAERSFVTTWIAAELQRAARMLKGHTGEVVLRRLNRAEYEYTIEDLFGVKGDFAEGFPDDAKEEGFDNNGAALMLSAEQMDQYLAAADFILDRSIQTKPRPETKRVRFTLHDYNREAWKRHRESIERSQRDLAKLTSTEQQRAKDTLAEFEQNPNLGFNFPAWENGRLREPTPDDGPEVACVIPFRASYGAPDTRRQFRVREAGWYRFGISAFAAANDGQPVRLRITYGDLGPNAVPAVADVIQVNDDTPREFSYRIHLQANQAVKLTMLDGDNWAPRNRLAKLSGPFVGINSMELAGPLFEQWPPKGHRLLLGERSVDELQDTDMPVILAELASRLFRRPISASVVDGFHVFYQSIRGQQLSILESFRLTAKAMMASPHFIYHVEIGKAPDDHALANRLSYFLCRSAPDEQLRQLATSSKLSNPAVLRQQIDRLLADERSERFLTGFIGQWLKIDLVGDMQPDRNLYPEYDPELERAMLAETRGFIRELLHSDLSVRNLIDSDWAILNDRLARHYGIPGVTGNQFRKVALNKSDTVRGGLLTQASILNITSNGTTTSPVVRGTWVLEQLLGTPAPPPPPDVPAIEPDIRGASTIKEQLEKHRTIPQCAACHRKIDPYGMALENFDVIGGWRESYRALQPTNNPKRPKLVAGHPVNSEDRLPQLGSFTDFRAFRNLLLQREDLVQQNMVHKLATFALGRTMDFADEAALQTIVANTQNQNGGLRTMIRELIASELFRKP